MQIKGPPNTDVDVLDESVGPAHAAGVIGPYLQPYTTDAAKFVEQKAFFTFFTVVGFIPKLGLLGGLLPGTVLGQLSISETGHTDEYDPRDHLPGGKYFVPDPPAQLKMPPMWLADP